MTPDLSSTSVQGFLDKRGSRVHASQQHRQTTGRLLRLYREHELLPGNYDVALFRCCPNSEDCWRQAPEPNDSDNAGISFPWIGKNYFDHRVVMLGMNFDNFGGLAGHYWVCEDHIKQMEAGKRGKDGRAFARGAMQYLRIVLASLDGEALPSDPNDVTNQKLADLWEDCAYLQRIKCAPGTGKSKPTEAMVFNCPPFLAAAELEILKPSVVLHLGRTNLRREWLVKESDYGEEQGPHLERDTATIGSRAVELISLNHPSTSRAGNVSASLEQLTATLEKKPLHG